MARKVMALPLLFSGLVGTAWAQDEPGDPFYVPGEPVYDDQLFAFFYGNRLEVQSREGSPVFLWDVDSWVGQDYNRIWLKTEGELGVWPNSNDGVRHHVRGAVPERLDLGQLRHARVDHVVQFAVKLARHDGSSAIQ